ncbi:MAG: TRAP transporter large permease subunit [Candidatus Dadabacteria bacterium]|nr:MAG: TRAP transporter large permease subunit [Candidatus Dadabacteria bacterium]
MIALVIIGAFVLLLLGFPLFAVIGSVTLASFALFTSMPPDKWGFQVAQKMYGILNKEALLAIPYFVLAGVIMTGGGISRKLTEFARSLVGWMPGGLGVATVFACVIFAAISGSSAATVVAIGMVMFPALSAANYPERFSLGLITSSGSLGILIPPSIPMIVYAIMVDGVSVGRLFIAGVGPGLLLASLLMAWCVYSGYRAGVPTVPFSLAESARAFRNGFWGILLPVMILGGIYSGMTTVNEAAALAVVYAIVVETLIHKEISFRQLPALITRSMTEMGAILMIIALAAALANFLTLQRVPVLLTEALEQFVSTKVGFLILTNIVLLVTGCIMDIISAILILAPIIAAVGKQYGVDPVHLGVIFIVNLEIGFLTPPLGLNLFVATSIFNRPFTEVVRGALPFVLLLLVGLLLITYIPSISLGLL